MTPTDPRPISNGSSSILVSYNGAPAALVGGKQFNFLGDVRQLSPAHPVVRVVAYMSYYAQLVLASELPGPYDDGVAEMFARAALIDPGELRAHSSDPDVVLAARFRVPVEQIPLARSDVDDPTAD